VAFSFSILSVLDCFSTIWLNDFVAYILDYLLDGCKTDLFRVVLDGDSFSSKINNRSINPFTVEQPLLNALGAINAGHPPDLERNFFVNNFIPCTSNDNFDFLLVDQVGVVINELFQPPSSR
jgi:hypothetical protein